MVVLAKRFSLKSDNHFVNCVLPLLFGNLVEAIWFIRRKISNSGSKMVLVLLAVILKQCKHRCSPRQQMFLEVTRNVFASKRA